MAKFIYLEDLLAWLLAQGFFKFEWDKGNKTKSLAKHGVTNEEIEEVFALGSCLPIGTQVRPVVAEIRVAIVGPTYENRMLTIVFTLRGGKVRPISARPTSKKELNQYEEIIRKIATRA